MSVSASNQLTALANDDPFNLRSMDTAVNYNRAITEMIRARAATAESVIDFGAGRGTFANKFIRKITCVEPERSVGMAIAPHHKVVASLNDLPAAEYDFVYSINVLEHIEDDAAALYEIHSAMKRGGKLFLLLPARSEIFTPMDTYVGHYRRYDVESIRVKLRESGFALDTCRYFDVAGYLSTLICKYAGKLVGWQGRLSPGSVSVYDQFVFPISNSLDAFTGKIIGKNILVDATSL